MSAQIDISGQKFNLLTVQFYNKQTQKWHCVCDCGNETEVKSGNLRNGHTKSCGCLRHKKAINHINIVGEKFGRATVIEELEYDKIGHKTKCKCQCDCGNIFITDCTSLRIGKTQSCGCYCKDRISETHKIDMIGKKFGKLLVLQETEKLNRRLAYKCLCDCGNITIVRGEDLRSAHTTSCGCLKSKGEDVISELLRLNNIPFEKEKTFMTCRFPKTNYYARFDFFVDNKYLIEFDGVQHFGFPNKWDTNESYQEKKERDIYKNNWCKENNISLIRIPYYQLNILSIEDLKLETSNFIEVKV